MTTILDERIDGPRVITGSAITLKTNLFLQLYQLPSFRSKGAIATTGPC